MRLPILLAVAVLAAGCGAGRSAVSELSSVADLRAQFNEDLGQPRLILILSPS